MSRQECYEYSLQCFAIRNQSTWINILWVIVWALLDMATFDSSRWHDQDDSTRAYSLLQLCMGHSWCKKTMLQKLQDNKTMMPETWGLKDTVKIEIVHWENQISTVIRIHIGYARVWRLDANANLIWIEDMVEGTAPIMQAIGWQWNLVGKWIITIKEMLYSFGMWNILNKLFITIRETNSQH